MSKPYYTRKNLITISLSFFYSFVLIFTGLCLEGTHSFASKKNPIALLGNMLQFKTIECGVSGFVCLALVAIYITIFVAVMAYEIRYAKINNIKPFSIKMIICYALSLLACLVLSIGVGILIQKPLTAENLGNVLLFVWQSIELSVLIYAILFALFGGILMFVINFLLVDKPFKAFDENEPVEFEDEESELDISANFDSDASLTANGSGDIVGMAAGGTSRLSGDQNIFRKTEELDDREKVFPALSMMDAKFDGFAIDNIETDDISLNELATQFRKYLAKVENLYFDIDTIRFFISGFGASHFMILEGLSGTGKSSLPRYFAKFINSKTEFIPVQSTWRDKTNLLGYFNDFSKTYSETEFLINLYHANYNPDMIHIFVLDEMNISRIEYYFADFLSVLEYPEEDWKLKIMQLPYNFLPPVKLEDGYIQIPNNVYFVGTANKDDSTFTIADKVYDRAITIDFENRNTPFTVEEEVKDVHLSNSKLQSLYKEAKANKLNKLTNNDLDKFQVITDFIYDKFDITFGNRILHQIEEIVPVFVACGGTKEDALDFLLSRKVISKLEGRFEEYVKGALKELLALITDTYGENVLKRSEKTIQIIMRRL